MGGSWALEGGVGRERGGSLSLSPKPFMVDTACLAAVVPFERRSSNATSQVCAAYLYRSWCTYWRHLLTRASMRMPLRLREGVPSSFALLRLVYSHQRVACLKVPRSSCLRVLASGAGMTCLPQSIGYKPTVRYCVIPTAGMVGGLFPASKTMSPGLLPIVDADGVCTWGGAGGGGWQDWYQMGQFWCASKHPVECAQWDVLTRNLYAASIRVSECCVCHWPCAQPSLLGVGIG